MMKIKPYDQPLYSAYKAFFIQHPELIEEEANTTKFFVEESIIHCENGQTINVKLQEIKKINLLIKIP